MLILLTVTDNAGSAQVVAEDFFLGRSTQWAKSGNFPGSV